MGEFTGSCGKDFSGSVGLCTRPWWLGFSKDPSDKDFSDTGRGGGQGFW